MRSPFFQSAMPPLNSLGRVLGEVELVPESRLEPRTMSNECGEERQRDKRQERVLLEQNKTRETTHNKRNPNRQWNSTPVLSTKTRNRAATVCSVILCKQQRHKSMLRVRFCYMPLGLFGTEVHAEVPPPWVALLQRAPPPSAADAREAPPKHGTHNACEPGKLGKPVHRNIGRGSCRSA